VTLLIGVHPASRGRRFDSWKMSADPLFHCAIYQLDNFFPVPFTIPPSLGEHWWMWREDSESGLYIIFATVCSDRKQILTTRTTCMPRYRYCWHCSALCYRGYPCSTCKEPNWQFRRRFYQEIGGFYFLRRDGLEGQRAARLKLHSRVKNIPYSAVGAEL
jgi:hypothetical protein